MKNNHRTFDRRHESNAALCWIHGVKALLLDKTNITTAT